jgi:CRP-like cAMP-binding protein
MHAAALISLSAMAFKDQLKLRSFLLISIALNIPYHLNTAPGPQWDEIFWNIVTFAVTFIVLVQLTLDRTHLGLSAEEEDLFSAMNSLTPGEFRALLRVGAWKTADTATTLTIEGRRPEHLFYVLSGAITIDKGGRQIVVDPKTFIGEVAFLHNTTASATVTLEPGARYLQWPVARLQAKIGSRNALKNSVIRLIGLDMALKIARA